MNMIKLSLGNRVESITLHPTDSEANFRKQLWTTFSLSPDTDIIGIKNQSNERIYSLNDILTNPNLLHDSIGDIVVGMMSPTTKKRHNNVVEQLFTYIFNECSHKGSFHFLDYFVLRVLYNHKVSSMTSAINLLLDRDYEALNSHLHTLINQVKDSVTIKMDILRLITVNMQLNNEITSSHASILLSLIQKEDGLICSAYTDFENTDNLAELKDALLRILLLTVKPDCINPVQRSSAQKQQSLYKGSWRSSNNSQMDITAILEELNKCEIYIYTLCELEIITEQEAVVLFQIIREDPEILHIFTTTIKSGITLTDSSIYRSFLQRYNTKPNTKVQHLYNEDYPDSEITSCLLLLEKKELISKQDYALLYRRCVNNSIALQHCYGLYCKDKNENDFVKNIRIAIKCYTALYNQEESLPNEEDTKVLRYIIDNQLLTQDEIKWVIQEYKNKNEVVLSSFDVCKETGDINGLVQVLRNVINMFLSYQHKTEIQDYLAVLIHEMLDNGMLNESQATVLIVLLQEPDETMCGLYDEYRKSGDFEGLINALIIMSNIEDSEDNAEEVKEGTISLPSKKETISIVNQLRDVLPEKVINRVLELIRLGTVDIINDIAIYKYNQNREQLINALLTDIEKYNNS